MPTSTQKQQALSQVLTHLKRHYDSPDARERPVLETLIYGVLREGATSEQADAAYTNLEQRFFDWNEIRVSQPPEVEAAMESLPDANLKAPRVIGILQAVFEREFSFKLDEIAKKGLKNALKILQDKFEDATDFAIGWVVQRSLGGHALPVDAPTLRCLQRLGVAEPDEDGETLRAGLEHAVPKAKGTLFTDGLIQVAQEFCWDEDPHCGDCPLKADCPTGQVRKSEARSPRLKPR
jgi:endonuclease III